MPNSNLRRHALLTRLRRNVEIAAVDMIGQRVEHLELDRFARAGAGRGCGSDKQHQVRGIRRVIGSQRAGYQSARCVE